VAVNPATNKIYVANESSANATVIDGTNNSTTTVATGLTPKGISVNPLTNKIYVGNASSANSTVIDGSNNSTTTVPAAGLPADVAINPVTNRIYVANGSGNNVTVIDGSYNTMATLAIGTQTRFAAVNPVTNKIYFSNSNLSVTVVDGTNNSTATVPAGTFPYGIEINPITNKIYVVNAGSGNVTVIDGSNNSTTTIPVGAGPLFASINPVTNKIYVANNDDNNVTVIDGTNNSTVNVAVGTAPLEIAANPVTNKVYVTNQLSNNVTVIDGSNNSAMSILTGIEPSGVAVNSVTNKIYVANRGSNTVTVIDGSNNSTTTVSAGAGPRAVAVNTVTNKIYVANGSNNVIVIDGTNNSTTTVAVGFAPPDRSLAVNSATNKVYVASELGNNITVIDGTNNSTTTLAMAGVAGPSGPAVNPVTNKVYVADRGNPTFNGVTNKVDLANEGNANDVMVITPAPSNAIPLNTAVTPLAGNTTMSTTPVLTLTANSTYSPTAPPPQHIYFQMDTVNGTWTKATNTGGTATTVTATASPATLQPGIHIIYFFATDGSDATSINPRPGDAPESSPTIGGINAYLFLVAPGPDPCSPLTIGYDQTVTGRLDAGSCVFAGPTDVYTFIGQAGEQIAISMDAAQGGVQPNLELRNAGGAVLVASDSGNINARIPAASGFFTLPTTDTYHVRAGTPNGTAGDYVLTLSQPPAGACNYTLSPSATNVSPTGGNFLFHVLTGQGCPAVTASTGPNSSHIHIVSNIGGQVRFSVDASAGMANRTGTIIAAGQTHTVVQLGTAAPANDLFAQAQMVSGPSGTVTGHNINATAEMGEPAHAGIPPANSVWYRWTAPATGLYSFTTVGSNFDTRMGIYTGSAVSTLTEAASNDDSAAFDLTSRSVFAAVSGTEYFIAIDGKNGETGFMNLIWRPAARTYRFYAQNGNGNISPRIPTITATQSGTGTQYFAISISEGVFELDLPVDNATYEISITGPDTWSPNMFTIDNAGRPGHDVPLNSSYDLVIVARTVSATVSGVLAGLTSTNGVTVFLGSEGGPNPIAPEPCAVVVGGTGAVVYTCQFLVDTIHQVKPSLTAKIFSPVNRRYPAPVTQTIIPGPGSMFTASPGTTYNITGQVTSNGIPIPSVSLFLTGWKTNSYITAPDGSYQFNNLPARRSYTITAVAQGYTFAPQTIDDLQNNVVLNISAQTACGFKVSTELLNLPAAGGQQAFRVNTTNGCQWRAVNSVPWLTFNLSNGNGTGSVYLTAQPNSGMPRKASITVADQLVTINQAAPRSITGRITYENTLTPPVPVPSTALAAAGTPAIMAMSGADGNYTLMGLGAGPYTVTPSKSTQPFTTANGIFSNDAALISRHVVGLITLNATQQAAARVGGQASISSFDASLIAQYIVGIPNMANQTGQWKFTPVNRTYPSLTSDQINQNFAALLMGDVSGDWSPAGSSLFGPSASPRVFAWDGMTVSLPALKTAPGASIVVPVRLDNVNEPIYSYQFTVEYDPSAISPGGIAADLAGTVSEGMNIAYHSPTPGRLNVVVYGAFPVTGNGDYLDLRFTVIGDLGSSTPLRLINFRVNDGRTRTTTVTGTVNVVSDRNADSLVCEP
jgi:YVTN family beta-propeller protein